MRLDRETRERGMKRKGDMMRVRRTLLLVIMAL